MAITWLRFLNSGQAMADCENLPAHWPTMSQIPGGLPWIHSLDISLVSIAHR